MSARQFDISYPKNHSYKPAVKKLMEMKAENKKPNDSKLPQEPSSSLPPNFNPQDGDERKNLRLKDGGRMIIINRGKEIYYRLKLKDGREVLLERTESALSLTVNDGKNRKYLACELKK